jgi:hypothetical protein
MKEYYVQRVKGGAGLIISEGTLISRQGLVVYSHTCQLVVLLKWYDAGLSGKMRLEYGIKNKWRLGRRSQTLYMLKAASYSARSVMYLCFPPDF